MPLPLLVALFLVFGLGASSPLGPVPRPELAWRLSAIGGLMAAVALSAACLGRWVSWRVTRDGRASPRVLRVYTRGARAVELLTLVGFGVILHQWEWPRIVSANLGLRRAIVAEDVVVLLPFVLMQLAGWWGLHAAERALAPRERGGRGLVRDLALRARQSLGLVLPALLVFSLGQDLVERRWPEWAAGPWAEPVEVAVEGALVLALAPLFLRLAWPTRPLPPGPLRSRLDELARRYGFRCTDILIWETSQGMGNACVAGALPWFRYVLLTDGLIARLDDHEIAAVFGHEIGHIAHRHLVYFGFFFAGSLGVLALLGEAVAASQDALFGALGDRGHPLVAAAIETVPVLGAVGLYFLVVFGHLSRRFERQADIFGCRAVSCGQADCPPHVDPHHTPAAPAKDLAVCPVGIRIFVSALVNVCELNGVEPGSRSWRHGSIARRIAFLEGLEGRPEAIREFQASVRRMRVALALVLIAAVVIALASGSVEHLR